VADVLLADVPLAGGVDQEALMAQVASLQALSEHPLASAMLRASKAARLSVTGFQVHPGLGVQGQVEGAALLVGSAKLMHQNDIEIEGLSLKAEGLAEAGKTLVYVARDGRVAAVLGIADQIKPSTLPALKALRAAGLELAMMTGDTPETAQAIADKLGITHVIAGVMPDGKLNAIKELQKHGAVAFVGDGINDAPALAQADVGLAIGTGTDIAVEAADVVLASGSLMGVARAVTISRATMRNIRQNLGWAFGYNLLLVPVAAGALYPMTGLLLSPMLAAGAMALSSVAVLSNALRLRWVCPDRDDPTAGETPNAPSEEASVGHPA
jgi:Cu+-exporting ATPase